MNANREYTQHQISESICYWSRKLLDEGLATEDEVKDLIGESLFRRAVGAVKRGIDHVKNAVKTVKEAPKKFFDRVFKPNDGVVKMLETMSSMSKDGVKLDGVKIYATLGKSVLPVVDFLIKSKKQLVLIVDSATSKPKTLNDLREFLHGKLPAKMKIVDALDGIYCAQATEEVLDALFESKLTDYIEKKRLSKKDALKPSTIKEIKHLKIMKKKDEDIKNAIEKYFSQKKNSSAAAKSANNTKKDAVKSQSKSAASKKDKFSSKSASSRASSGSIKANTNKTSAKDNAKDNDAASNHKVEPETKDEPSPNPTRKDSTDKTDAAKSTSTSSSQKKTLTMLDNELLDVKADNGNLGFIFSKSKAEIQLDKEYEHMFSH